MNKQIFLITDTHFNHRMMVEAGLRPEGYEQLIYKNWNKIVGENDLVIHLGDVIFGKNSQLTEILNSLNGTKILVKGNHDKNKNIWYLNHGFDFVCDRYVYENILFSHMPQRDARKYGLNIHGHFHNTTIENPHNKKLFSRFYNPRKHLLLSLEKEKYKPVLLETFLAKNRFGDLKRWYDIWNQATT